MCWTPPHVNKHKQHKQCSLLKYDVFKFISDSADMYVHAGIWLCMQHGNIDLSKEHCENHHPHLSSTIAINESDVLQWTVWSNTFWVCAQYSYKYRWYIIIKAKHCRQLYTTLVEQELLTLTEYQSSTLVVSKVRVTRSLVLCVCFADFYPFSIGNCVVYSSSIYWFWLPLWYLQTLLVKESIFYG